ncbi:cyclin domain-containing protein [Dichotomocladium elegans]|nr:cyclin domain-containing protein [Dichotomocladium elegans]
MPSLRFRDENPDALLGYIAMKIKKAIPCSTERRQYQHLLLPSLTSFIRHIYYQCRISSTVLVIALIYLTRFKRNLPHLARGEYDTPYKIFLSSILIASKYVEDHNFSTKSIYKVVSPLYSSRELAEMERSFLGVVKKMALLGFPWPLA